MNNKFRYPIFPDRVYTLEYDFGSIEIKGEDILAMLYRQAYLENFIADLDKNTPDLSTDIP